MVKNVSNVNNTSGINATLEPVIGYHRAKRHKRQEYSITRIYLNSYLKEN